MRRSSSIANQPIGSNPSPGTVGASLEKAGGITLSTESHTLDGNGAQNDNIFQVTGVVRLLHISAYVSAVTNATTCTGFKFDLSDGAVNTDITATVDLSGVSAGSYVFKDGNAATALALISAATAAVHDPGSTNKVDHEMILVQKGDGTATYIRANFTGDADTDITVKFKIVYEPLVEDAEITALV